MVFEGVLGSWGPPTHGNYHTSDPNHGPPVRAATVSSSPRRGCLTRCYGSFGRCIASPVGDSDDELLGDAVPIGPPLPQGATGSNNPGNPFLLGSPSGSPTSFVAMMLQMMDTTQAAVAALSSAASNLSNRYETHAITGREMSKIFPKVRAFQSRFRRQNAAPGQLGCGL